MVDPNNTDLDMKNTCSQYSQSYDYDIENNDNMLMDYDDCQMARTGSYHILKEDELIHERDSVIEKGMENLYLERDEAIIALINYNWSLDNLQNWYDDVDNNKIKCGLELSEAVKKKLLADGIYPNNEECQVCFSCKDATFSALKCGHYFCGDCWNEYLSVKADDILVSLSTTCPQKGCPLVVPESFFMRYLKDPTTKDKIFKAILKNFTANNLDIKMCPSPNCNICIKCETHISKEISCLCGKLFCFKCYQESHRPCTCLMISKWETKNKSDSESDQWIRANTKECPHCHQKIERSKGCNYMLCDKKAGGCGKAFCYVCEIDWEKHSQDHFNCNNYTQQVKDKENEASRIKAILERTKFYHDRYVNYIQAVKFAEKIRPKLEQDMATLVVSKQLPLSEVNFIKDSLNAVVSGKRTLKYTYVFGYYLRDGNEKKLFEFSQALLERNADNLHQLIEGDKLTGILALDNHEDFTRDFLDFRNKTTNLYAATVKFQTNLLNEIESSMIQYIDDKLLSEK